MEPWPAEAKSADELSELRKREKQAERQLWGGLEEMAIYRLLQNSPRGPEEISRLEMELLKSRRSTIILAFSLATALLLGAVAAWAAACAGGRHRDGAPLPEWMANSDRFARKRLVIR